VSECDRGASIILGPGSLVVVASQKKKKHLSRSFFPCPLIPKISNFVQSVFHTFLRINMYLVSQQHQIVSLCNGNAVCCLVDFRL
jgi:hypothetical protein